jgi:hypothetical protein
MDWREEGKFLDPFFVFFSHYLTKETILTKTGKRRRLCGTGDSFLYQ